MRLTLNAAAAPVVASSAPDRTLTGVAVPYGVAGATSAGLLTVDAGAVRVPEHLRRIKLFREHGRTTPVGYATAADNGPAALSMTFALARTPDGDTALLEAAEGIRDALSVELDNVTVTAGHVTAADLVAVAQVAVPAYADAVLTGSNPDPAPDPDPDPTTEETTMPETTTADPGPETAPAAPAVVPEATPTDAPAGVLAAAPAVSALAGAQLPRAGRDPGPLGGPGAPCLRLPPGRGDAGGLRRRAGQRGPGRHHPVTVRHR